MPLSSSMISSTGRAMATPPAPRRNVRRFIVRAMSVLLPAVEERVVGDERQDELVERIAVLAEGRLQVVEVAHVLVARVVPHREAIDLRDEARVEQLVVD